MNRNGSGNKPKTVRRPRTKADPNTAMEPELGAEGSSYVARLASAVAGVSAAQGVWLQEIEAVSLHPELLRDMGYQGRLAAAMSVIVSAAGNLRIEPVPVDMQTADALVVQACTQAGLAAERQRDGGLSVEAIVDSIRHLDEMSRLLQEAYASIRD